MTRAVLGTIGTRVLIAAGQLLVAALAAQLLGLAEVGRMSLLVLGITFIMLANNVMGGGALVYLEPRHGTRTLRLITGAWAALVCGVAAVIVEPLGLVPAGLGTHAAALAFLEALGTVQLNLLLGRQRFELFNGLQLIRTLVLVTVFAALLHYEGPDFHDFLLALYASNGATLAISAGLLARAPGQRTDEVSAIGAMLRQGIPAQAANGLQLLNYRLSYFFVQRFHGAAALGLWSISTQLAESAWLAPKSLGTVLYAHVSNLTDAERQRDLTLSVLKLSVGLALLAALFLMALPNAVFIWFFGPEATGIGALVLALTPGLLAMAASQALSHYLSGVGLVRHNAVGSGLAALATVALGYWLIPGLGTMGAALTASAAYCLSCAYQLAVFNREAKAHLVHYLPNRRDGERLLGLLRFLQGG